MEHSRQEERSQMVAEQLEQRGIRSARLLNAFRAVPRHLFVPADYQAEAYLDEALPLSLGQTISQPFIVGLMTSLLNLKGAERVLEVGTGSGYQAAILSRLCAQVHTIELEPRLAELASQVFQTLGYKNITVHVGDGTLGWLPEAPYEAILVTAAGAQVPQPLLEQLTLGGRLVIPLGGENGQVLEVWQRVGGQIRRNRITQVRFVPLRGKYGWSFTDWSSPDNEE